MKDKSGAFFFFFELTIFTLTDKKFFLKLAEFCKLKFLELWKTAILEVFWMLCRRSEEGWLMCTRTFTDVGLFVSSTIVYFPACAIKNLLYVVAWKIKMAENDSGKCAHRERKYVRKCVCVCVAAVKRTAEYCEHNLSVNSYVFIH